MKIAIVFFLVFTSGNPPSLPDGSSIVSHATWDELLKKNVSAAGKVNYRGFQQDQQKLNAYLDYLSKNAPGESWNRREQLAYWINAYNAYTVSLIVKNYPCKSITALEGGKPWDKKFAKIGTQTYSLNHIEHEILRKQFTEPRIHFAVNCAAKSCPRLLNEAFTGANLEGQLERLTREFINNPALNKLAASGVQLSSIFDWYKEDFSRKGTLIDFLNRYSKITIQPAATVSYLEYDWSLNE
jgi:hypothetical protein